MKIPCDIIRDLLPLYHDSVCSAASRQAVEEHLEQCQDCRKELQLMDAGLELRRAGPGERDAAQAASAAWKRGKRRAFRKGAAIAAAVLIAVLIIVMGVVAFVCSMTVDMDAGACSGGYDTFIFDKYSEELTSMFVSGSTDSNAMTGAQPIRGTQNAEWEGRTIYLQFDIRYQHPTLGTVTERVHFIGHRTWIDTFDWSLAISCYNG